MLKVLLDSFEMCRHKLYQILSINKNVPCFVLLITGYHKVYTKQDKTAQVSLYKFYTKHDKNAQVLKFSNSKVHYFSLFETTMQNQYWLSQKLYIFFFFFLFCIFLALYNRISDISLSFEL